MERGCAPPGCLIFSLAALRRAKKIPPWAACGWYISIRLTYADGTVEIVEIKSKFVRRMQRDYPVRRRVFLEQIARPAGWKFTEIITAEDKDDLKRWRELAKEG